MWDELIPPPFIRRPVHSSSSSAFTERNGSIHFTENRTEGELERRDCEDVVHLCRRSCFYDRFLSLKPRSTTR